MLKSLLAIGVLSVGLTFPAPEIVRAQEPRTPISVRPLGFYDHLNLLGDDTTKARLDINFNISHKFFVFVRSKLNPNDFVARGEIIVEILDSKNLSVAREIFRKELHRHRAITPPDEKDKTIQGNLSFALDPGTYTVMFEVDDLESNRRMPFPKPQIILKKFSDLSPGISDVLLVRQVESVSDSLYNVFPANLGGDVEFGKNFFALFQAAALPDTLELLRYGLYKIDEKGRRTPMFSDTVRPALGLEVYRLIPLEGDTALTYSLRKVERTTKVTTYLVSIRGDTLQPGRYDLEFKSAKTHSSRKAFSVRWLDKPRTLENSLLATEAMEYLMSEKEFEDFSKKSHEEKQKSFEEFWRDRDPTPETAYNEAMAEYYHRCDYVFENFATLKQTNGIKTDRGKIYVLFGPPTKTERFLNPNAHPKEIWFYESLAKRFTFVDEGRNGNYKLISSETL